MTDTLKSICEHCTHLQNPQLDFIPPRSQRPREIIRRDLRELVSAASMGQEKTVTVLSGVIFESVLYCFIESQSDFIAARRGSFTFKAERDLGTFVSIFNRWFSDVLQIPKFVVTYRDMVHINQELENPSDICSRAAPEMLRLLDALLEKLAM